MHKDAPEGGTAVPRTQEHVDELIIKYLDDAASEQELAQLRELLKTPEWKEAAVESLVLTAQLARLAKAEEVMRKARFRRLVWVAAAAGIVAATALLAIPGGPAGKGVALTILSVTGQAEILCGAEPKKAQPNQSFSPGQTLRTGADSSVVLSQDGGSRFELGENGELTLMSSPAKRLSLVKGTLRGDVRRQEDARAWTVATPTAEAEILGTLFKLDLQGERARLDVEIGRVQFRRLSDGKSIDICEGQTAIAAPGVEFIAKSIFGAGADGRTLYVDQNHPSADDSNPGSPERPLKTISKAAQLIEPGDKVIIKPGVYREGIALMKGGTKDRPVVFQAEKSGTVVITGADPLKGWTKEPGDEPVYSVNWPHDFFINVNPDGSLIRHHGADPPVGCAEQLIWDSKPLTQVMSRAAMKPGTFFVDWDRDRLYVWLPGGRDPNASEVLGSTRSTQFERGGPWGNWAKPEHVHIKGIIFRYAANFAQRGGVKAYNGWRIEDCTIEWNNGSGLSIDGDDVVVLRVTSQDNGFSGIGGGGKNGLVKDCVVRRNNRKGFPVGWEGGGGKFCGTNGLHIVNHTSYDNTGPGIWLDWDNRNYVIEYCTCYGNHGNEHAWEGMGIFIEANDGPGRVVNNTIYSNTGSGIEVAESQHVLVEDNILVDNGAHIGLRAMEGRAHHKLENVIVRANKFKNWRGTAVGTSLGRWGPTSVAERKLVFDANIYDPPPGKPLFIWGGQKLNSLEEVRTSLHLEEKGITQQIPFTKELVKSEVRNKRRQTASIAKALANAKPGDTVSIPVNGRTTIALAGGRWTCQVFDLENTYVTLDLSDASVRREVEKIDPWPRSEPVYIKLRLTKPDEGVAMGVSKEPPAPQREGLTQVLSPYKLAAEAKGRGWVQLDLSRAANRPLVGEDAWIGLPLADIEPGVQTFRGVPFRILPAAKTGGLAAVALRSAKVTSTRGKSLPDKVELSVGRTARAVYFLHGAGWAAEHRAAAVYELVYSDGSKASLEIIPYGRADTPSEELRRKSNIQDWWPDFPQFENDDAKMVPIGEEDSRRYLYTLQWVNPQPAKPISRIRLSSFPEKESTIIVLAITLLE